MRNVSRVLAVTVGVLLACKSAPEVQPQGGIAFTSVSVDPGASFEEVAAVCWPFESDEHQRVTLHIQPDGNIFFDVTEGASNSTARCLREVAALYPAGPGKPTGDVTLSPPWGRLDGWSVLAWVKLLSSNRQSSVDHGIVDAAPLVKACASTGMGLHSTSVFQVTHIPNFAAHVIGGSATDSERCVESVLGAMAWPNTREFTFTFGPKTRVQPAGSVAWYFGPQDGSTGVLEPQKIKDAVSLLKPKVAECWNAALARRPALGGGRTIRFRAASGRVVSAWVVANASDARESAIDYILDGCLVSALSTANFEGASGEGVYSWVFAAR